MKLSTTTTSRMSATVSIWLIQLVAVLSALQAAEIPQQQSQQLQQQATQQSQGPASESSTSSQVTSSAGPQQNQMQQQQQQPLRLPKINIYINKNEIKKLLGIQSQINYVTAGNINAYPFNFAIPLGLNQSEIIFTWQNLGTTNVNYSISLAIHNLEAVDSPLINITRTGMIPKHEQVFKITLPCSGKVNDEVDVQVLINITGYAATDDDPATGAAATDSESVATSPLSQASKLGEGQAGNASAELMQSDQQQLPGGAKPQQQQQLVSHTLAIRRKKICTAHHNQIPPQAADPSARQVPMPSSRAGPMMVQKPTLPPPPPAVGHESHWPANQPPAHHRHHQQQQHQQAHPAPAPAEDLEYEPRKLAPKAAPSVASIAPQPPSHLPAVDPAFPSSQVPSGYNPSTWPAFPARNQQSTQQPPAPPSPMPMDLVQLLSGANAAGSGRIHHQAPAPVAAASPFLPSLVAISLLISVALVAVIILVASPLDKLNRLTRCLLKRAPGSVVAANKCKSPMAGTVISSLRAGPKSAASSVSGLSAVSGQSGAHSKSQGLSPASGYCYKNTNCAANGYFTSSNQYHQHHYQHPPTADLLGTGYQCQPPPPPPPQQQQHPPQYPSIYHIATGNSNQTTRLIWQNGNGTNPDGFTIDGSYMPLSNAPRSDTGSVYQTIY